VWQSYDEIAWDRVDEDQMTNFASFPNLRCANLSFHEQCTGIATEGPPAPPYDSPEAWPESYLYRARVLEGFFNALSKKPDIRRLGITNLQNINPKGLVESTTFTVVLGRLESLRLRVLHEHDDVSPRTTLEFPEIHDFMNTLPST